MTLATRTIPDPALRARIAAGDRINTAEALTLLRDWPLHDLGALAFARKRALHGDVATFIVNKQVNPTNLCVHDCKFCEFAAKPGDAHEYSLEEDDIIASLADPELTEVHIVGGLWKTWGFDRALALVRRIRATYPDMWIKAFTAVEINFFALTTKQTWQEVLSQLREAGMDGLPGGGAEVLSERIHLELYKAKMGPDKYIAIHEAAHAMGIQTNCTMLFGHIETDEELISHLMQLRESQDRTRDLPGAAGFEAFIPLAFQPGGTGIRQSLISPMRCLRLIAVARLVLDNIPHIKAYWPTLQIETAVTALSFGADDLDGTIEQERIMHLAGSGAGRGVDIEMMYHLIREAGQTPMRRNGRFGRIPAGEATTPQLVTA